MYMHVIKAYSMKQDEFGAIHGCMTITVILAFIIPIKLDECLIPEQLKNLHWMTIDDTRGFNKVMKALKNASR